MRILDVSPRVTRPLTSGSRIRMYNLLSRLSRGHEVRQFSQTRTRDLRQTGFATEVCHTPSYLEFRYSAAIGSRLCEWMERQGFGAPVLCGYPLRAAAPPRLREWVEWADVVVVEFPWQFEPCRRLCRGKPLVLSTHNVQAAKARSGPRQSAATRVWAAWTEALERAAVRGADHVLAVSEEDRGELAARYGVDAARITVVPNGADTRRYRPAGAVERAALRARLDLPSGPMVIYPAPHRQTPIVEGLKWVRRAAPHLREVTFLITGAAEEGPKVEGNLLFTGFVDEYESYLRSADAMLCPIAHGGGTKLKLIEAAAAGLPIVAFAESVRGTRFRAGEHLQIVRKETEGIVAGLRGLLEDSGVAERLGEAARALTVQEYDWDAIAGVFERVLAGAIAGYA